MSDYISKSALIDNLRRWRNDVVRTCGETDQWANCIDSAMYVTDAQPTIDAVPVTRCRDCKHKDKESGFCAGRGWPMQLVADDGFCEKGERRENATD